MYARLYYVYRSALVRTIRLLLAFFLLTWMWVDLNSGNPPKIPFFFFGFFLMVEVYFHFKVARVHPSTSINANKGEVLASCTMQVLYAFIAKPTTQDVIKEFLSHPQVRFILERIVAERKEITFVEIDKDTLIKYSFEVTKRLQGEFVTTMDIFASYLLLTEQQTKLLFNKKIKPEELLQILYWARRSYQEEEHPKKLRVHFDGGGIGDALTTGWTLETKKYTSDFTYTALRTRPLHIGRQQEYNAMIEALLKGTNNNVVVVGENGSGKETLVGSLAYESFSGSVNNVLNYKHFYELMVGQLIAGASDRSELELRLQAIIEEISHAKNVIIYIPDFQNILGASSYGIDLSGALLPYLQDGMVPIVATITYGNYKAYLERNPLQEVLTVIKLPEPDVNTALQMLFEKTADIERKYHTLLSFRSVVTAIEYANRYVQDGALPGSAVTLLNDAANGVALTKLPSFDKTGRKVVLEEHVVQKIEERTNIAVAAPSGEEKELLLHLEEKLHERVIDQVEAITAISEAMRRLRTGLAATNRPISFLFLGPTGVGKTETAKALAQLYYGGEQAMIRLDMSEYSDDEGIKRLLGALPGEGEERGELTDQIHDNPSSLVLLDEFEKAHPKILDLFLQVLEDGRLTDNKGQTVSFVNSVIIATSNAGSEFIRQEVAKGAGIDKKFQTLLLDHLQSNHIFKPELLNRFDDVVVFKPLGEREVAQITQILLDQVKQTLAEQDITVTFDQRIVEKIAKDGADEQFGARPLRRYIQDNIADLIAQKKLRDEIRRGSTVIVTTDDQGKLIAQIA